MYMYKQLRRVLSCLLAGSLWMTSATALVFPAAAEGGTTMKTKAAIAEDVLAVSADIRCRQLLCRGDTGAQSL